MTEAAPTPAALPPHVLERADVRSAIANHDFGEVFRLARLHGNISFAKISEAVGYKREHIGKMARPETEGKGVRPRITQFHKVLEVVDGLRIPGHLAGVAPRPWELARTATATPTDDPSALIAKGGAGLWDIAEMLRRTEMSHINSAALESIEQGIDQLARAYPYADADYLHERTRSGLHYVTKQLESRMTLRQHRELLVDTGWLFLLNACVQYDRGQREAANLSKAAALRIGEESGHGEIKAWAWEIEAWFALTQSRWQDMLDAVEAGHVADQTHSVGVQLYAHKARAAARMGDSRLVRDSLDAGRARLDRLPRPDHPEHHFIIDPDKWDFYEMDAYRLLGDDERAATHARSVIRISTGPDGTEISPMRAAEARLTLGVAAARIGEIDEAIGMGTKALEAGRKSLPSLLLVADELDKELRSRYPRESATRDFHEQIRAIKRGPTRSELPF
ncbi:MULTISPECIES: tetratricopeptide repeat protein [Streptomyces]|uniref:tetratricopeptide repeat protein n=1 Tax=Streptomyces TaxID=1883 RepID=UPI00240D961B|nr:MULTISPECIES: tetratricopeptide repeat protein [Streptomyces]WFB87605.1 tetratricopeptide repeat protein [Streptomyces olivaceus]WGK47205.1 tetratricopeptide repeat protein [Streptomyces sp. B146]